MDPAQCAYLELLETCYGGRQNLEIYLCRIRLYYVQHKEFVEQRLRHRTISASAKHSMIVFTLKSSEKIREENRVWAFDTLSSAASHGHCIPQLRLLPGPSPMSRSSFVRNPCVVSAGSFVMPRTTFIKGLELIVQLPQVHGKIVTGIKRLLGFFCFVHKN
jgi:hypothetical protein